jgi:Ca-dependent carbohydrate-binding module xylan-binding/Glycosyl hydrolases family 16
LPSTTKLTIRARARQYCRAWPHMVVLVDGRRVLSQKVSQLQWSSYPVAVSLSASTHTLVVKYDNDYSSSTCDRNLDLDYVDATGTTSSGTTGDPAPTPSPSPTPSPAPSPSPTPTPTDGSMPTADLPGWHLVLNDDFPGTSLDLTKWYEPYDSPSHQWRPQQVTVHDGVLDIDAAKQADGYWWSSGVNGGRGLKQTYGKYLVRARFDAGRGISDALMVFPTGTTGCDWPPEIDFSESGGDNDSLTRTSYSGFYHYRSPVTGCGSANDGRVDFGSVSADFTKYHIIGVEWTPGKLVYTLDGQPWATSTDINIGQFNTINGELVLQSQSCNELPCTDATTPLHVHLIVDWVAIYAYRPLG